MKEVPASAVNLTVVSAKVPERFILRGIKKWTTVDALGSLMMPYVAIIEPDLIEWTFYTYPIPGYIVYGNGDIPRHNINVGGIYLHRWVSHDTYGEAQKLKGL